MFSQTFAASSAHRYPSPISRDHLASLPHFPHQGITSFPATPSPRPAPSPSTSLSQASPSPLPSVSFWSLLGTLGQLSQASPNESVSEFCWSLLGNSRQLSWAEQEGGEGVTSPLQSLAILYYPCPFAPLGWSHPSSQLLCSPPCAGHQAVPP